MAKATPFKANWNGGELSPRMAGRADQQKYGGGASLMQNFLPMVQGCLIRRGGTLYIAPPQQVTNGAREWLIPFLFNIAGSYMLEFGDQVIRFYTNRGIVSDVAPAITGVTRANPAVVTVASPTGISNGDMVYMAGVVGMTQLNNNFYKVAGLSGSTFHLVDIFGNTVNSTGFTAYTSGGTAAHIYQIASPYAIADITDSGGNCRLKVKQSEDVVYICHPAYPMQQLSRFANTNWTLAPAVIANGPFDTINTDKTITVTLGGGTTPITGTANIAGHIRLTVGSTAGFTTGNSVNVYNVGGTTEANGAWTVTVIDATHLDLDSSVYANAYTSGGTLQGRDGFTGITVSASKNLFAATDVGRAFYLESPLSNSLSQWQPGLAVTKGQLFQAGINTYISLNAGTTGAYVPIHTAGDAFDGTNATGVDWLYMDSGYGILTVTTFTNAQLVTCSIQVTPPLVNHDTGARSYNWALGLYSATSGYPELIEIFRDRVCLVAGIRLAGSVTSDYLNFSPKINGQVQANSGFVITLPTANPGRWMVGRNALLVGTAGEEIAVGELDVSQPLGPTNIQARIQTSHGGRLVDAVPIEYISMFVTRSGQQMRQVIYNWAINGYMAEDMTTFSEHIPKGPDGKQGITQMAWQQEPDLILWACTSDGRLIAFTYNRDQQVICWHQHPLGGTDAAAPLAAKGFTNAVVESVAAIPAPDGSQDDVWMIVKRTINGQEMRYVELLSAYFTDINANIANAVYMDSAQTYSGAPTTVVHGATHLIGQTIDVLADGGVVKPCPVVQADGSFTIPIAASVIQFGEPCPAKVITMKIEAGSQLGSAQGAVKRIVKLVVRLLNSLGVKYGNPSNPNGLDEVFFRTAADLMDTPVPLFTGDTETLDYPSGYERDGMVEILCDKPLPVTLIGIRTELETYETLG